MRVFLLIWMCIIGRSSCAQTLGGKAIFNFLDLPAAPQLAAAGGVNVSLLTTDAGLAFNNPALLDKSMHSQLSATFNNMPAGIHAYQLSLAYHHVPSLTNILWGVYYLDYGQADQTDASGNIIGNFRASDWVMQVEASRSYLQRWQYGITVKFISSTYGVYHSNGIALDVGLVYKDSSAKLSAGLLAKNMGFQVKKYAGSGAEDLPFDLQAGITKRLNNAPFGFSLTARHLHRFYTAYDDTLFNRENGLRSGSGFFKNLFNHFVAATHIYAGDKLEATIGYNHMRRQELKISNGANGLNGFSAGLGLILPKFQVHFARSWYQQQSAYNQLGLNLSLNQLAGLGKMGREIGW